jgi:hypothetical protein
MLKGSCHAAVAALAAALLASCAPRGEESSPEAPGPAAPVFYYDLGPGSVDVSSYPKGQQENYKTFLTVCGACHGAARSINSPHAEATVWKRYMGRMQVKMESLGIALSAEDEKSILDFLVYDSKLRKVDRKTEFEALQEQLKNSFEESEKKER